MHGLVAAAYVFALTASRVEITETVELDLGNLDLSLSEHEDDAQAARVSAEASPPVTLERAADGPEPKRDMPHPDEIPPMDEPPPEPKTADISDPQHLPPPEPAPNASADLPAPSFQSPVTQETRPMPSLQLLQPESAPAAPAPVQARVDVPPKARSAIKPQYPKSARERGAEGSVELLLEVAADGSVAGASVISTSGHADLDEAALKEARRAKFKPAQSNGKAVASSARITLTFRIRN